MSTPTRLGLVRLGLVMLGLVGRASGASAPNPSPAVPWVWAAHLLETVRSRARAKLPFAD